jgi:hypothetical protein
MCIQRLVRELEGRDHLEDLEDHDIMNLKEIRWDGVDWINLAQDRDKWQALMNMVINVWIL